MMNTRLSKENEYYAKVAEMVQSNGIIPPGSQAQQIAPPGSPVGSFMPGMGSMSQGMPGMPSMGQPGPSIDQILAASQGIMGVLPKPSNLPAPMAEAVAQGGGRLY